MVASLRVVEMRNTLPTREELRDLFQGAGWRALLEGIGQAMADQVRRNMLAQGGAGPTGDFALLSGWGVARQKKKEAREAAKRERARKRKEGEAERQRRQARREQRASDRDRAWRERMGSE